MIIHLTPFTWGVFIVCAACIGLTKTAFPALGALPSAIMALIFPAHISIGIILIISISADTVGVYLYRKCADFQELKRLIPSVVVGLFSGWIFLLFTSSNVLSKVIGTIIALFALIDICTRLNQAVFKALPFVQIKTKTNRLLREKNPLGTGYKLPRFIWGIMGGFTTMTANAGGSIMSLYLINSHYPINNFVGTQTWFFACVNLLKLPFSMSAGAIQSHTLCVAFIGGMIAVLFAILGKILLRKISRTVFDSIILILTLISAAILIIK